MPWPPTSASTARTFRRVTPPENGFVAPANAGQADAVDDRIVVIGGALRTLDMLRLAVVRSDDVVLIAERIDAATRRFIAHFAIDHRARDATEVDLDGAAVILVAIGDRERENRVVRDARRRRLPVHVADRALVSDFTLLEMFGPLRAGPMA